MIPTFLRPEFFPFTSVDVVPAPAPSAEALIARKTDSVPFCDTCDGYAFVGHVCPGLVDDVDDREELCGFTCGASCGYCGRCS